MELLVVIMLISGMLTAMTAVSKKRSFALWYLLGLCVVGLVLVAIIPVKDEAHLLREASRRYSSPERW